jgi:hypothetical protein
MTYAKNNEEEEQCEAQFTIALFIIVKVFKHGKSVGLHSKILL